MNVIGLLVAHGPALALGSSLLLAAGCLAVLLVRTPFEQRRLGVLTALALLLYAAAALVPLPRWSLAAGPRPRAADSAAAAGDARLSTASSSPGAAPGPAGQGPQQQPLLQPFLQPLPEHRQRPQSQAALRESSAPTLAASRTLPQQPLADASAPRADWGTLLAALYLLGSAGAAAWLLLGWLRLRRLLRCSRPAPTSLAAAAGVPVRVTDGRTRAFCTGALRPVVVLPSRLLQPGQDAAARAVLQHELAHVRAGDCRIQLLLALLLPLCWWQPLFWWLRARVRFCSELLADDAAANHSSAPRYARELLGIIAAGELRVAHAGAVSVFHRSSEFYRRMQMLLNRRSPLSRSASVRRRLGSAAAALAMVVLTAGFCGIARAQEPAPQEQLQREAAQLRQMVRELKAEVAALQQRLQQRGVDAAPLWAAVAPGEAEAPAQPGEGGAPGQPSAGVPMLKDVPVIGYLFRTQGPTGGEAPQSEVAGVRRYTVQRGDSLERIARRFGGGDAMVEVILRLNPDLEDVRKMRVGQVILLPKAADGFAPADSAPAASNPLAKLAEPQGSPEAFQTRAEFWQNLRDQQSAWGRFQRPDAPPPGAVAEAPAPMPAAGDRSLTDLLNVVTRTIGLRGEVEIAEAELQRLDALAKENVTDRQSMLVAKIKLRTLKQQLAVAEQLLKGELARAKAELQRLEQLQQAGLPGPDQNEAARIGTFVEVLKGAF